ncbi:tyrosine-type recombinase/integrase [Pseudomonas sp. S60]|uniref:tyrosine-type recombinase/integrase n=1 Tax=Pseudomonas sp. S60 TaxID=211124 RepID=UPI001912D034|nr:tyrosine-type recombinase/integrase [Pseudomonas sp. S60]MBK5011953.1 tyrosine-type recombinase/integrase [Pseudomonas sp. S60]
MKNQKTRKLFSVLPDLKLFGHRALGKTEIKNAGGLPFLTWPNGAPCSIANLYMLALRDRPGRGRSQGLSREGEQGGTIGVYAARISPLIRFCFDAKLDFIQLNDQLFSKLIEDLREERALDNPAVRVRTETTLIDVGRACIDFLQFVGRFYGEPQFVSENGSIRVTEEEFLVTTKGGRTVKKTFLHHHSLTIAGRRHHTRDPITLADIKALRAAVNSLSSSRHVQLRRNMMLSLYEHTGARRGEIANIRVDDIKNAMSMKRPMLRLITLKVGGPSERLIPISRAVLTEANKYINMARKKTMRRYKGGKDHGFLMVQEITGKPLSKYTLTSEISALRKHAEIDHQACGHMFRHAFITNLFVLLIKRHKFKNQDDFRNTLINSAHFIAEVMMWTGQQSASSVERYIHLAFAQIEGYAETVASVHIVRTNRIYDRAEEELLDELDKGISIPEYKMRLQELKRQREEDLKAGATGGDESLDELNKTFFEEQA